MKLDFSPAIFLDLTKSIAGGYFEKYQNVWEIIPDISDIIIDLIKKIKAGETTLKYTQIYEGVWAGENTYVENSALIKSPAIIGANCEIRHCAYIRGNVIIGDGCVIGNSTELKNVIVFDKAQIPHFNYAGDSVVGYKAHLGASSILSNQKSDKSPVNISFKGSKTKTGLLKLGSIVGDKAEIGCGSVLNPGSVIGKNCVVYPLVSIRGYIEENHIVKDKDTIIKKRVP